MGTFTVSESGVSRDHSLVVAARIFKVRFRLQGEVVAGR